MCACEYAASTSTSRATRLTGVCVLLLRCAALRYRRPALNLGRRGFDGFDFSRYNATEFAGLENAHAHAYVNRSVTGDRALAVLWCWLHEERWMSRLRNSLCMPHACCGGTFFS